MRGQRLTFWILYLPPLLWLAAFLLAPLALMAAFSFRADVRGELLQWWTPTLEQYASLFAAGSYWRLLWISAEMALAIAVSATVLAYPVAYFLAFRAGRRAGLYLILLLVPFWTSYLLRVYAWVAILGDKGAINSMLKALGLTKDPIRLFLYDNPGVFIVLVYLYFPFAALTLYASLERFDWRLLHAAVDLGATPMRAIANTLLPQMRLALVTAGIFVFIPILGEYLAPSAIGGTHGVMMGNLVANFFSGYLLPLGSAASVLIAMVITIVLIVFRRSLDTKEIYV